LLCGLEAELPELLWSSSARNRQPISSCWIFTYNRVRWRQTEHTDYRWSCADNCAAFSPNATPWLPAYQCISSRSWKHLGKLLLHLSAFWMRPYCKENSVVLVYLLQNDG